MNRQLKDLILQAQMALGTRVEVDSFSTNGGGDLEMDLGEGEVDEEW
jgi:hypothetical protein